jgi:hypothetical protein
MKLKIFKDTNSERLESKVNAFLAKEKSEEIILHSCNSTTGVAGQETLFVGSVFYEDIQQKKIIKQKK